MGRFVGTFRFLSVSVSLLLVLGGCTKALVHDDVKYAQTGAHCSGSESVDDSSLAVLPIPVVAFFVPHWNLHDIKADDYLRRCGEPTKLINRHVEVNRLACIPAGLTRIISLGIWQWCPASVSWEADLKI
ncbi:hypothetical protein [Nitrospira moscoviensis]|uniref:Lipoprotein n=1 Tax=Nitrospira moscoviensis TaxID=42253 RepID=A0A0K2G908_NITMO|nr:hypothetical protein [Nitrospira moscoviensis]ALA57354.1 conserved exported protein of unknown function [Nitrospira moscoviensis]